MALIHCNECGKEISEQAMVCPNCGAKTQTWFNNQQEKKNKRQRIWYFIIFGFIILVALVGITWTFFSIDELMSGLKGGNLYSWSVESIILSIVGIGFCCWFISRKRTFKIKGIILAVYCVYILGAVVYFGVGFTTKVKPYWNLQKLYCNENAIENLQDKEICWGDIKLTFNGNDITFVGKDNQVTLPIDTIDPQGEMRVTVSPQQLASVVDDFEKFFNVIKESDNWQEIDKYASYLYISPSSYYENKNQKYNISYKGYYAREPEITYRGNLGTASLYGLMYGIQQGAYMAAREAINSLRYDDSKAGLFTLTLKIEASSGYLQPRTVPINTTTSTPHTQEPITDKIDEEEIKPDSVSAIPNDPTFDEIHTTDNRHALVGETFKVMDKGDGYSIRFTSENDVFVCTMGDYDAYCSGQYSIQDNGDIFVYFGVDDSLPFQLSNGKTENLNCFTLSKDGWLYINEGDRRINLFKYTKF